MCRVTRIARYLLECPEFAWEFASSAGGLALCHSRGLQRLGLGGVSRVEEVDQWGRAGRRGRRRQHMEQYACHDCDIKPGAEHYMSAKAGLGLPDLAEDLGCQMDLRLRIHSSVVNSVASRIGLGKITALGGLSASRGCEVQAPRRAEDLQET